MCVCIVLSCAGVFDGVVDRSVSVGLYGAELYSSACCMLFAMLAVVQLAIAAHMLLVLTPVHIYLCMYTYKYVCVGVCVLVCVCWCVCEH